MNAIKKILQGNWMWMIPVIIIALTLPYKFSGNAIPYLKEFFQSLFGDRGGIMIKVIGIAELISIIQLGMVSTRLRGAILVVAIMLGAVMTHIYLVVFDWLFIQALICLFCAAKVIDNEINYKQYGE